MPKRNLARDPREIRLLHRRSNDEWRVRAREDHASGEARIFARGENKHRDLSKDLP